MNKLLPFILLCFLYPIMVLFSTIADECDDKFMRRFNLRWYIPRIFWRESLYKYARVVLQWIKRLNPKYRSRMMQKALEEK